MKIKSAIHFILNKTSGLKQCWVFSFARKNYLDSSPPKFVFLLLIRGGSMLMAFTASQGTFCSCWHGEATNPNLGLYVQTGAQKPLCMWKEMTAFEKEKGRRSTYSLNVLIAQQFILWIKSLPDSFIILQRMDPIILPAGTKINWLYMTKCSQNLLCVLQGGFYSLTSKHSEYYFHGYDLA